MDVLVIRQVSLMFGHAVCVVHFLSFSITDVDMFFR